ncbi:hypothetical protein Scep_021499 [Stephania cephalantha]|uniref:Uncharacterized protein n=1 Tax=Stephania cephalantha TaxID=152367 RepID=A0AAP0I1I9_9MAGN
MAGDNGGRLTTQQRWVRQWGRQDRNARRTPTLRGAGGTGSSAKRWSALRGNGGTAAAAQDREAQRTAAPAQRPAKNQQRARSETSVEQRRGGALSDRSIPDKTTIMDKAS